MADRKFYPSHCWVPLGGFDLVPRKADKDENYAQLLKDEAAKAKKELRAARAAQADAEMRDTSNSENVENADDVAVDDDDEDDDIEDPADLCEDDSADGSVDEDDQDDEDTQLVSTDNLIVVAQVQQSQGISEAEIHVYNEPNKQFYVHRCFYLDSMPLCFEWVGRTGHLLAVGCMEPAVQLWDLDLVEALLPSAQLEGHRDAVLDLAWNPQSPQALASASADKRVGLWDLDSRKCVRMLDKLHKDKVQCLAWHPQEPHFLLSGGYDSRARLTDCRSAPDASASAWKLDGEVERVVWDRLNPFYFWLATEAGSVHRCDARAAGSAVSSLTAHTGACSGLCLTDNGLLCTGGSDSLVKLWRFNQNGDLKLLAQQDWNIGEITKLTVNPDHHCVLGITGLAGFQVWDVRENAKVRKFLLAKSGDSVAAADADAAAGAGND